MTTFNLTIEANNAAFEDAGAGNEVARILRELADRLEDSPLVDGDEYLLRDYNGNTVGKAEVK